MVLSSTGRLERERRLEIGHDLAQNTKPSTTNTPFTPPEKPSRPALFTPQRLPGFATIRPSRAVFGVGVWQAIWMIVFFVAIGSVYDAYGAVNSDELSSGMQRFLEYDARFIGLSFFLRASVCFLIAASPDRHLQRRTLVFWSVYNLLPLCLVVSYADLFRNTTAFWMAAGIPIAEALVLGYLGWVACASVPTGNRDRIEAP